MPYRLPSLSGMVKGAAKRFGKAMTGAEPAHKMGEEVGEEFRRQFAKTKNKPLKAKKRGSSKKASTTTTRIPSQRKR